MVPVERQFAPIGLTDKLNSGGALASFTWVDDQQCELAIRDGGDFLAYSRVAPTRVEVDGEPGSLSP